MTFHWKNGFDLKQLSHRKRNYKQDPQVSQREGGSIAVCFFWGVRKKRKGCKRLQGRSRGSGVVFFGEKKEPPHKPQSAKLAERVNLHAVTGGGIEMNRRGSSDKLYTAPRKGSGRKGLR